jgi:hypothetical protein
VRGLIECMLSALVIALAFNGDDCEQPAAASLGDLPRTPCAHPLGSISCTFFGSQS